MALERVSEILKMADQARTSAIGFNCTDFNMVHSAITVAEELNKPVIIMLYPEHARDKMWTTTAAFAQMVKSEAKKVKVPVGLHLDHCSDYAYILEAIKNGFQSVMYDGSMLPLEENIKNTREVVKAAKAMGADVEAELGHVGFADTVTDQSNLDMYTKPDVAARFCEETGCSSIAVAVGTAHGFYKETPKLDIERLKAINAATDVPLVMHGGTGVPEDQLAVAFQEGINKINVGTEYYHLYYQTVKEFCEKGLPDFFDMPLLVQERLMNYLRKKMLICKM